MNFSNWLQSFKILSIIPLITDGVGVSKAPSEIFDIANWKISFGIFFTVFGLLSLKRVLIYRKLKCSKSQEMSWDFLYVSVEQILFMI